MYVKREESCFTFSGLNALTPDQHRLRHKLRHSLVEPDGPEEPVLTGEDNSHRLNPRQVVWPDLDYFSWPSQDLKLGRRRQHFKVSFHLRYLIHPGFFCVSFLSYKGSTVFLKFLIRTRSFSVLCLLKISRLQRCIFSCRRTK